VATLSDKAGYLIVGNLIKYGVGFVMPMVLVRMLSQHDFGTYQQLSLISSIALGIVSLGLPTSIYYFYNRVEQARRSALLIQTSLMLAGAALFAGVLMLLLTPQFAAIASNPDLARLLPIFVLTVVFTIASEHFIPFMISQDRYKVAVSFEVGETLIRVAVLLLPLWLGYGLTGLVVATTVYMLIRFLLRSICLYGFSDVKIKGWSRSMFPVEQLKYGVPLALVGIVSVVGSLCDRALIAASFTPKDYAIYSVGALEIPLDVIFQAAVANVLRASLPPLVENGNITEVIRILREAVRKLSIIVLPSFVFLFGFGYEFITTLFTKSYEDSVHVFRIYLFLMPLHMLIVSCVPQVFGKTKINLQIVFVATLCNLVMSFVFLKWLGFYGPAVATVASAYIASGIYLVVVVRLTRTTLLQILPFANIARVLAVSGVALAAAQLSRGLSGSALANLIMAGLIFSVVFLLIAAVSGVLTSEDKRLIRAWTAKVMPARMV
jgi:O-antigen/teichoic acid export membrane protein